MAILDRGRPIPLSRLGLAAPLLAGLALVAVGPGWASPQDKDKPATKDEKPKDKPAEPPKDKPADPPKDKPAEKPVDPPKDKPADPPKDKPADKPVDPPKDKPTDKPKEDPPKDKPTNPEPPKPGPKVELEVLNKPVKIDDLQKKMAEEGSDLAFKLTRLDRVFFAYQEEMGGGIKLELRFEGVCLEPEFNNPEKRVGLLQDKLAKLFYEVYPDVKVRFEKRDPKERPNVSIAGIKPIDPSKHPVRVLQQLVQKDKRLDGSLFHGASFNGQGQVVLEGLLGKEAQKPLVTSLLEKVAGGQPPLPGEPAAEKPAWLRQDEGKPEPWVLNMPVWEPTALLQGKLAVYDDMEAAQKDLCRQTLVRKVYFTLDGATGDVKCWVEANCVMPGFKKDTDPENLRKVFHKVCNDAWTAFKTSNKFLFDVKASVESAKVVQVPSPVAKIQNLAIKDRTLDGMLIEKVVFDEKGTLRIHGFVNHKDHVKKVEDLVKDIEKENPNWLGGEPTAPPPPPPPGDGGEKK